MPSFQGCEPGANPLIERYFHDCVYGYQDGLGFVLGMAAIGLWLVAMLPQFIDNIRRGSSDGISVWFLAEWFLGDTLNLLGCLVQGQQLPTTTFLAMYFVLVDVVMLMQFIYLGALQKRRQHLARIMAERAASRHHHHHHGHRRNASAALRATDANSAQPSLSTSDNKQAHDSAGGKVMQLGGGQDVHFRGAAVHGPSSHMLSGDSGGSGGSGTPGTHTLACHDVAPCILGDERFLTTAQHVECTVDGGGGEHSSNMTIPSDHFLVAGSSCPVHASTLAQPAVERCSQAAYSAEVRAGELTGFQPSTMLPCSSHRGSTLTGDTSAALCIGVIQTDAAMQQQQDQHFSFPMSSSEYVVHNPDSIHTHAVICATSCPVPSSCCLTHPACGAAATSAPVQDMCLHSCSSESLIQPMRVTSSAMPRDNFRHQCSRPEITPLSALSQPLLQASQHNSSCEPARNHHHHHRQDRARWPGRRGFIGAWGSISSSRSGSNNWAHAHHCMVLAVAAVAAVSVVALASLSPSSNHALTSSAVAMGSVASGPLLPLHHPAIAITLPHGGRPLAHIASILPWLLQQTGTSVHSNDSSSDNWGGSHLRRGGSTLDDTPHLHASSSSAPDEDGAFGARHSSADVALLAGTILGYLSSLLYLTARCAQISKNIQRGTTEGMSVLMFAFTIAANTCTGTSIILRLESATQLANQLPWMFGTFGTVSLDVFLLYQGLTMGKQADGSAKKLASSLSSGPATSLEVTESGGSEVVVVVLPGGSAAGCVRVDRGPSATAGSLEPLLHEA